ncbi:MAG: hypothetical protein LBJ00_12610 [Planctomycetaceae bacterium]|nr:hypothetical protein [Planctomycetaceae bacterium]
MERLFWGEAYCLTSYGITNVVHRSQILEGGTNNLPQVSFLTRRWASVEGSAVLFSYYVCFGD